MWHFIPIVCCVNYLSNNWYKKLVTYAMYIITITDKVFFYIVSQPIYFALSRLRMNGESDSDSIVFTSQENPLKNSTQKNFDIVGFTVQVSGKELRPR
jgi:hypothetical protein